jgi:hypothetical protein
MLPAFLFLATKRDDNYATSKDIAKNRRELYWVVTIVSQSELW